MLPGFFRDGFPGCRWFAGGVYLGWLDMVNDFIVHRQQIFEFRRAAGSSHLSHFAGSDSVQYTDEQEWRDGKSITDEIASLDT